MIAFGGSDRYGGGVKKPGIKPSYSFMCYDFDSFSDASYAAWELSQVWEGALKKHGLYYPESANTFGVIPSGVFRDEREIWEMMAKTIRNAGYEGRIGLQVDAAADSYYITESGKYRGLFTGEEIGPEALLDIYLEMVREYPFVVIEDPFYEDDYEYHTALTKAVDIQVVGDDLFTTNPERLKKGVEMGACNTMLLKVNQIGTITEALNTVRIAKQAGYQLCPATAGARGKPSPITAWHKCRFGSGMRSWSRRKPFFGN
jgi:enolase